MLDPKHTRSIVGLVTQEPVLFDTTVEENISLGKQDASIEEIQTAAKDANAHGFVSTMPEGYGTLVGKYLKHNQYHNKHFATKELDFYDEQSTYKMCLI